MNNTNINKLPKSKLVILWIILGFSMVMTMFGPQILGSIFGPLPHA